ncbi:MAG: alpha/beta fold hydrolase [Planctomycetales bacterium]|nr:alpha/beta fold hydrolase [Planctomycetales bacterium]
MDPAPKRRSERVSFPGGSGFQLGGIVDFPVGEPLARVVFTHCFTCNKDLKAIVRISRGLAELGFLVLRYDLTGLGHSSGDFSQTNFSTNRADLAAAVEFVATEYGKPQFLVGHSFGAACSLSSAQAIDSVLGVVSLAAPSDTSHLADRLLRMDPQISTAGCGSVTIGGRTFRIHEQMLHDFRSFDLPTTLRSLSKPALLFHSPEDETLGFEHVLRLYSLLTQRAQGDPAPSAASLMCLPGADHLLVKNPADITLVTQVISAWMHRHIGN